MLAPRPRSLRPALAAFSCTLLAGLALAVPAQATEGTVKSWGVNDHGQLGDGTTSSGGCSCKSSPVSVTISDTTQVSGSYYHAVALRSDGSIKDWGYNAYGELGNGSTTDSNTPVDVSGISNAIAVSAGYYHSIALLADGTVVAWGDNEKGELGQGTTTGPEACATYPCSKTPIPVPGLSNVIAIDAGYEYNLALLADGTVMAWGWDIDGQLGDAPHEDLGGCECIDRPVPVPGVSGAVAISAGWYLGSALRADGTIVDWGYNEYGEVGDGERFEYVACECRGPTQVVGVTGASQTSSGAYLGLALFPGGAVSGWGYSYYDELGISLTNDCACTATPMTVAGISGPRAISAGENHELALMPDGSVESWGDGAFGQLGNGSNPERATPAAVPGISGASAVDAEDHLSFAIIGASQTLTATVGGSGRGSVGGERIVCPASVCSASYPQGRVVVLRAEAAPGSRFDGFSGACSGTGVCRVTMDQARSVTATFSAIPPSGTKITSAKVDGKKRSAGFSFEAPGMVEGFECKLTRPKPKKKAHKAAAAKFSKCTSPEIYKHLAPGRYTFEVRAFNTGGKDATPARKTFRIEKPASRKGKGRKRA